MQTLTIWPKIGNHNGPSRYQDVFGPLSELNSKTLIVQEIQERISAGKLQQGFRLPSERAFAAELGVSRTSVQAALRELETLGIVSRRPNCRPMVASTPTKLSSLVRKTNQIALWMLPELQDMGGAMILQGIRSGFSEYGYSLLITSPPSNEAAAIKSAEIEFLRAAKESSHVAGVVIWDTGNADCHDRYNDLVNFGMPLVFVDRAPGGDVHADVVAVNHRKAAKKAINHLLELGHTSIGMVIGNDRASSVLDRIDGYESALRDHGITPDPSHLYHLDSRERVAKQCALEMIDRITQGSNGPTAIFAVNDRVAFQLLEAAEAREIPIPERLSLVGFDWLARWMPSGGNLTTVAQPFEEIGRTVAGRILDRLATPTQTPRQILFDAELILKDSTAPPANGSPAGTQIQARK